MHRYRSLIAASHPGVDFAALAAGIRGRSPAGQRADDYNWGPPRTHDRRVVPQPEIYTVRKAAR